jgi:hypothetical protein
MNPRNLFFIPLLALALLMGACASAPRHIRSGTYSDGGMNSIIVDDNQMTFDIVIDGKGYENRPYKGQHTYALGNNGKITIFGSSNSAAYLDMVTNYSWRWDNMQIVRTKLDNGKTVLLRRQRQ